MNAAPDPKDVQEFQFKQSNILQIFDGFTSIPRACSLASADKKRGLLYVAHDNKVTVLKITNGSNVEWKIQVDLPFIISKISLNCDCSLIAITSLKSVVLIYDAYAFARNNLVLLSELELYKSYSEAFVLDLCWNPTVTRMICAVNSDHIVGCFEIKSKELKPTNTLEQFSGFEVLCVAWSPKGRQIVAGCKTGDIVQLKPDLKIARTILGPRPYIGEVVTILWISNYQFCAAYLNSEQHINVLIIDAPKGEKNAIFTCYEDITYGMPEAEGEGNALRYYFDHVPEWGLIIAGSSVSSEIAILGTTDGGSTWNQWQLIDSGRAQLPLIETTESYPVGLAIDKSPDLKLAWGTDSTLPHPVPVLHIFGTSGQLCSYHMVNLAPNCHAINFLPTEIITAPPPPPPPSRPSMLPSEISFSLNTAATSTPRVKQSENIIPERPKAAPVTNIFGDMLKTTNFFPQAESSQLKVQDEKTEIPAKTENPPASIKKAVSESEMIYFPVKYLTTQEAAKYRTSIDDSICVQAYLEEHNIFEKELQNRLEPQSWECGTEEERKQLGEKSAIIDQFLRDLRETTNSLSSDIAYLKALLLQSFAWLEEAKSKNAVNTEVTTRSYGDNSKIAELQRLFSCTQFQLRQADKALDLEWSEHKSQGLSKMKIPSTEFIYQNLLLHNKIIMKEKDKIEELTRKCRSLGHVSKTSGLNRMLSNLSVSSCKSTSYIRNNTGVIEARCKTIASKTHSFTVEKQRKLKNLLMESCPKIIKPVNPSPIQDRLEATLSCLASLSPVSLDNKNKSGQFMTKQSTAKKEIIKENKIQSPLSSLNSMVAKIGVCDTPTIPLQNKTQNKLLPNSSPFSSVIGNKMLQMETKSNTSAVSAILQPKQNLNETVITFEKSNTSVQTGQTPVTLSKPFSTVTSTTVQKVSEPLHIKSQSKVIEMKNDNIMEQNNTSKVETPLFSTGLLSNALSSESSSVKTQNKPHNALSASTTVVTTASIPISSAPEVESIVPFSSVTSIATNTDVTSTTPKNTNIFLTDLKTLLKNQSTNVQNPLNLKDMSLELDGSQYQYSMSDMNKLTLKYNEVKVSKEVLYLSSVMDNASINLTSSVKIPETSPETITIEEVSDIESPTFEENPKQSQPITTSINIFAIPPKPSFSETPISTPLTYTTENIAAVSPPKFSGFTNVPSTISCFSTSATSNNTSPFYSSLSKPMFDQSGTNLETSNFTQMNISSSNALTFNNSTTVSSIAPTFSKDTMQMTTNTQFFPTTPTSSVTNVFAKPIISSTSTTSPFDKRNTSSIFGGSGTSTSTNIFSGNSAISAFGGTSTGFMFDQNATKSNSLLPGGNSTTGSTNSTDSTTIFDSTSGTSSMIVGGPSSALESPSGFGQAPTFDAKPIFGESTLTFDTLKLGFGNSFGTTTFGGNATAGGFGSLSTMGSNPPPFGKTMPTVFEDTTGSNTFESLASQAGGLTFSSLAQKSPEPEKPQVFTSGSSFSNWR